MGEGPTPPPVEWTAYDVGFYLSAICIGAAAGWLATFLSRRSYSHAEFLAIGLFSGGFAAACIGVFPRSKCK